MLVLSIECWRREAFGHCNRRQLLSGTGKRRTYTGSCAYSSCRYVTDQMIFFVIFNRFLAHVQSVVAAPDAVRQDIDRFKKALMQMFAAQGKCAVFFERNYRTQHLQIQVIPVPIDRQQVLKTTFFDMAAMKGFELTMLADDQQLWDTVNEGCPYFYVEQPDGNRFFTRQMKNFPLQFGREVSGSVDIN